MNVLSLFDGISCGHVALEKAGHKITYYYASEVDKYAIQIANKNYSDTIHIGDVRNINITGKIPFDLLIGGSPCQGFSVAGKKLNFWDPRSKLFFEYVRILKALIKINPSIKFLLENVRMKKEWQDIISNELGVQPVKINSALVCAQNRVRLYWANWGIEQPEDRGIVLRDILENDIDEKYFLSEVALIGMIKHKERHKEKGQGYGYNIAGDKTATLLRGYYKDGKEILVHSAYPRTGSKNSRGGTGPLSRNDCKTYCLDSNKSIIQINSSKESGRVRRLTPIECERLQGLPDDYTHGVSNSQRYKQLGNGWQIDTLEHIFSQM